MPVFINHLISKGTNLLVWEITEDETFFMQRTPLVAGESEILKTLKNSDRKKQWLSIRLMLSELFTAQNRNGFICYNKEGKPFLSTGQYISISHTADFSALIISDNNQVGIDVEKVSERIIKVKDRITSTAEREKYGHNTVQLTTVWAAKECVVKLTGQRHISFENDINILIENPDDTCFKTEITLDKTKRVLAMNRLFLKDHVLVYVIDF